MWQTNCETFNKFSCFGEMAEAKLERVAGAQRAQALVALVDKNHACGGDFEYILRRTEVGRLSACRFKFPQ